MPTQVRERKQNGTTKCNLIAAVRPTQPLLASKHNSSAAALSGIASSTDGSQSNGAPQEAITNGKELRVRVRLASATSSASRAGGWGKYGVASEELARAPNLARAVRQASPANQCQV
jgi:hypothetical protein